MVIRQKKQNYRLVASGTRQLRVECQSVSRGRTAVTPTDCTGVVITDTVHAATRPRRLDATTTSSTFIRRHSSPHLWNQLPSSFRQPHLVHYPSSPHPAHITSSQLSPSFSRSVTPSTTPDLKLISFTNPFLHSHSYSFRTAFTHLNLYCIKGALFCLF